MLPTEEPFHLWRIAKQLGLGWGTYYRIYNIVRKLQKKLDDPNLEDKTTIFSQVVKSKGWTKIDKELKQRIYEYIRRHPSVVTSPIKNDTVFVQDSEDPSKKIKKQKLLLQIPVTELHSDIIRDVPECTSDAFRTQAGHFGTLFFERENLKFSNNTLICIHVEQLLSLESQKLD
mgnify:CR=1 FL=1